MFPVRGQLGAMERPGGRRRSWNDPAAAGDPAQAGRETEGLARRLDELRGGTCTPEDLRSHLLEMCAMCQKVLMDVGEGATKEEVISRLEYCVARLREVAGEARSASERASGAQAR
ncbi:hypothetical protein BE08_44655 [Sorangium cellulosum]|uniref:Uncharacterized protein n=1 Tax=Sorangium cellulosum TaxID=56 RepID=A0A150P8H4_SORCE|nr:hypothetical protein BE08_44655 [Sorangium cellulosum]